MDTLTPEQRRRAMAAVKSRDTKPELVVRRLLHGAGYRFRLQRKDLPGKPDIVLTRFNAVIFVHGCFWHQHSGCKRALRPTTRREYWESKLDRNIERDAKTKLELERLGWRVHIVWECETQNIDFLRRQLVQFLQVEK
ncbi:very short patch repair endonuclease [Undibacterium curvum]|uniref:Very short patch repair endonuclease n=1 Tax=Undibacterium curvum TaxID=2762294 RepID=A0ABR7A6T3_9BURK|nr:very short patch repair endonuclease [Undibacterium curvum]MBC3932615.1 DNA mismatch endonuclease Vsr [Undibacterium curvum]